MRKRKPKAPPWQYTFQCAKCDNIQELHDPKSNLDGDYCIACLDRAKHGIAGPIQLDEARRIVRCECFTPIPENEEDETK